MSRGRSRVRGPLAGLGRTLAVQRGDLGAVPRYLLVTGRDLRPCRHGAGIRRMGCGLFAREMMRDDD